MPLLKVKVTKDLSQIHNDFIVVTVVVYQIKLTVDASFSTAVNIRDYSPFTDQSSGN